MVGFDAGTGVSFLVNILTALFSVIGTAVKAALPSINPIWLLGGGVIFLAILYLLKDQVREYVVYSIVVLVAIFIAAGIGLFK